MCLCNALFSRPLIDLILYIQPDFFQPLLASKYCFFVESRTRKTVCIHMCLVFAGGVVWALVYLLLNARISIESCHGATELTFRIGYLFPIIKLSDINSSNLDYKLYILINYQFPLFGFNHEIFRLLYYVSCLTAHSNEYPLKLASYKLLRASMLAAYPKTPLLFCT